VSPIAAYRFSDNRWIAAAPGESPALTAETAGDGRLK